jgi:hypothetical protein
VTEIPRIDPVKYLLLRKFGTSALLGSEVVGGATADADSKQKIREYEVHLESLSQHQLIKLFQGEQARALLDEQRFNSLSAQADFEHWTMLPHWTLDEAIALSFNKSPEQVNWQKVKDLVQLSSFALQYSRRRELMTRAAALSQFSDPVSPTDFVAWAEGIGLPISADLKAAVKARSSELPDWKALRANLEATIAERDETIRTMRSEIEQLKLQIASAASAEPGLGTRERNTLVRLVIGMAIGGYAYDPKRNRSGVPAEISNDLESKGLGLDLKTIRKYLDEGADLVPPEV